MPTTSLTPEDYLKKILTARVYDVAIETSLDEAYSLSKKLGNKVLLKREDQQPVRSFKLRGAYNKMSQLTKEQLEKGVICASAGNHAQGVAQAAVKLGCKAVIVMPITTPKLKIDAVRHFGGDVVLVGESYTDAYAHAIKLQAQYNYTFIHPFDDPDVIAGQGTIAMEILQQVQAIDRRPLDAIFVAIGGGGMVAGIACYIKTISPSTKVIGVQMDDSDAMLQSVEEGGRIALSEVGLFSDGTAVKLVGEETFRLTQMLVDEIVRVDTDSVCAAIKEIFVDTRAIVEPAGALSVAGLKQYVNKYKIQNQNLAAVLCGANVDFDRLSFVAERARVGEEREALFCVRIPEKSGSLRRLCELIAALPGGPFAITEFNYRISSDDYAQIFLGVGLEKASDAAHVFQSIQDDGYTIIDLTQNELAKMHLKHMIGGHPELAKDERLFRFEFPERPGALLNFSTYLKPNWNISLFHYRNNGGDSVNILIGLQVPKSDDEAFCQFLYDLGYAYIEETQNPAYQLFLR